MPDSSARVTRFPINASLAAIVAAAALSMPPSVYAAGGTGAIAAKPNPPVIFAQSKSDLPVDPNARFGRLANGMSYVIYKNATPPGAASVWMRVGAGSVMESEDQRGLAHFIEHMAFNGSKHVPEGEMIKILQRDGLQFGADTNAQTSNFQTVYMLNLPSATQQVVGDALFLMRETAGNISFNPGAIDRERGVILGEERARGTVDYRAYEASLKHLFPGSKYAERMPIGLVDVIKTAKRPAFLRFYNDFYRPEYTTLIVAGDINPDEIEGEIRQRFSDWHPGPQSAAAATNYGKIIDRQLPASKVFAATGLTDIITVSWVKPSDDSVETRARADADKLFAVANSILSERLTRLANSPGAAFLGAELQKDDIPHTAQTYSLSIAPKDGDDGKAFDQVMSALREFAANGPTQAELDRAVEALERRYEEGAASARTIPTQAFAGLILESISGQGVVQSPAQALAEWQTLKPRVTRAAIVAALSPITSGDPPVLWRQGEQEQPFDQAAILEAWQQSAGKPIVAATDRAKVSWPYTHFGTPGAVIGRQDMPEIGATRVTFANGLVVTIKPTQFEDNAVHVSVQIGTGLKGVARDKGAVLFMAKQVGLFEGGLGQLNADDVREALNGKIYDLGVTFGANALALNGSSTTGDFPAQMQVLAAFMSDPGLRGDALERVKAGLPSAYLSNAATPDGVYALKVAGDFYNDDPRFSVPNLEDALKVSNDDVADLVRGQLSTGPVEVSIVGDISPEAAINAVAATLGALPARPVGAASSDEPVRFPTSNLHRVYTHTGRSDQNLSVIAWPTADYSDSHRATVLELLASVLTLRELDQVRERQGASYSASASSFASRYFSGFGFIVSRATVRPEVDETYYRTVSSIAESLKAKPVSSDELNRARLPLIDRLHNDQKGNAYWMAILSGSVRDPRQISVIQSREHDLRSVTAVEIQEAARLYLKMDKALRVQVKPK